MTSGEPSSEQPIHNLEESAKDDLAQQFEDFISKEIPEYERVERTQRHRIEAEKFFLADQSGFGNILRSHYAPNPERTNSYGLTIPAFDLIGRAAFYKNPKTGMYHPRSVQKFGEGESFVSKQINGIYFFNEETSLSMMLLKRPIRIEYNKDGVFVRLGSEILPDDWTEPMPSSWVINGDELGNKPVGVAFNGGKDDIKVVIDRITNTIRLKNISEKERPTSSDELSEKYEDDIFGTEEQPKFDELDLTIPLTINPDQIARQLAKPWLLEDPFEAPPSDDSSWLHANLLSVVGIKKELPGDIAAIAPNK